MGRRNAGTARERARAAKRELDAERALRDKAVEDAATLFYEGQDAMDEAQSKIDRALLVLVDELKSPAPETAALLGLEPREINSLLRQARERAAEPESGVSETSGTDAETS